MKVVVLDFEYRPDEFGLPDPVCLVARDRDTGRTFKAWLEGSTFSGPPFPCDANTVLVAHGVAIAESLCWSILGWGRHLRWIDTYAEESVLSGGSRSDGDFDLLACAARRGLPGISPLEKSAMQNLILRGAVYSETDKASILDYCATDVLLTAALFESILKEESFDVEQAIVRGAYAAECGRIHQRGVPVDGGRVAALISFGGPQLRSILAEASEHSDLAPGGSWSYEAFAGQVRGSGLDWPLTPTGKYSSDANTLKLMGESYGEPWKGIARLKRDLAETLSLNLDHGLTGRVYSGLGPFRAITGRCAPKSTNFLPSKSKWMRSLIRPPSGRSLICADWSGQEYAIAAGLSSDAAMMAAYRSGDPYLAFGKMCGGIPSDGTRETHGKERDRFKVVSLGVLMGMGADTIGRRTGGDRASGQELLRLHRRTFPRFWEWSDRCENTAAASRPLITAFGYTYLPRFDAPKPRTARNFLLQATGAEMLRIAVLLLADSGAEIVATVHDSIMVECDTAQADAMVVLMRDVMEEASRICLGGKLIVRVDVDQVDHPLHYGHPDGLPFLRKVAANLGFTLDSREEGVITR